VKATWKTETVEKSYNRSYWRIYQPKNKTKRTRYNRREK